MRISSEHIATLYTTILKTYLFLVLFDRLYLCYYRVCFDVIIVEYENDIAACRPTCTYINLPDLCLQHVR